MEKLKTINRTTCAKYILLGTMFILAMLNWNMYSIYQTIDKYNPFIMAAALLVVLFLVCDVKSFIKDKLFCFLCIINAVAVINLVVLKSSFYVFFILFDLSLTIFLAGKIIFTKREIMAVAVFMAFFFFYWTFDVKGFYKGYSVNYGGLVLISGFIFVIFCIEYLRYRARKYSGENKVIIFIKRYPYIFTAVEAYMFLWGYNIISWYRSRTAFFGLVFLALLLLIPRKIIGNRIVFPIIAVLLVVGGFVFPAIYEYYANTVNIVDYQMFYKPIFDSRFPVWQDLYTIYKNFPITGVGTIYAKNVIYREGLMDTMNSYIDLLVVHGPIVCVGILSTLVIRLIQLRKAVSENAFSRLSFIGIAVMLFVSYGESMITTVPFMLVLLLLFIIGNSGSELAEDSYKAVDVEYYKKLYATGWGRRIRATALVVALPIILILVLGPVEIYYSNYDEFHFTNIDYLGLYLGLAVVLFMVFTTILSVVKDKYNKPILVGVLSLSVASYVQYMFLNKKLILEDGEFINATDLGDYPIKTLIVFVAVIALVIILAIILRKKAYDVVTVIAGGLVAITIIATCSLFITHIGTSKHTMWYSGVDQFKVAPNDNVIVIVPDTFGRWIYDEMLKDYPESDKVLHDFTFYDKEDSQYYPTFPALHHMLTAYPYDGTQTRFEYTKAALESDVSVNFFKTLHDKNYTVRLYTSDILFEDLTIGMVDNVEEAHVTIDRLSLFKSLFKMSMYRYMPYVLKGPFEVNTLEIDNINVYNGIGPRFYNSDFYPAMHEEQVTIDERIDNAFIMHHIRGAHMPYMSDANNEWVPDNSVKGSETAYGTMKLIGEYLDYLRAIDKYDDSTIIIVGDHGFYTTDAIFFMKKKGEKHDQYEVDHTPITHEDFQRIVLDEI